MLKGLPLSASRQTCRAVRRGSGRRQSTHGRLVPQSADPHIRRLSMSDAALYHVIRWSVLFLAAITLRLFSRVLGADDTPFRSVMGTRGEAGATTGGAVT